MNVKIENAGGCRRLVDVEVPADVVQPEYDRVVGMFAAHATVPGFRPGKAPKARVEAKYRKQISKEVQDAMLPKSYHKMLEKEALRPVSLIDLQDVQLDPGKGMSYRVVLDVVPEFKLPKYHKITVTSESAEVTDAEVEEAVKNVLERFSRYEDASEGSVQVNDMAQVDYQGTIDGKSLDGLGPDARELVSGKDFWVPIVEESEFLPGFNAGLDGVELGSSTDIEISFPEDYRLAELAGQKAVYHVEVKGLRKMQAPELNEAFFQNIGMKTEDEFRSQIRQDMETSKQASEQARKKAEVSEFLTEKTKFDPPQSQVEQETSSLLRSMLTRMAREGATREMMEQHRDAIMGQVAEQAAKRVKLMYIIDKIAEAEKIEVTDEDVSASIAELAKRYGVPTEKMQAEIEKQENGKDQLRHDVMADKVLSFLLDQAKIKNV